VAAVPSRPSLGKTTASAAQHYRDLVSNRRLQSHRRSDARRRRDRPARDELYVPDGHETTSGRIGSPTCPCRSSGA